MGQCQGRPWEGEQAVLETGRVQGPRVHPCWPWRSSLSGCAVFWALVPPAVRGRVGCKDLSHTPQSPWEPFVPGWVCSYTAWRCLSSPRACSGQHLELLREQRRAAAVPETRPMWSTAPPPRLPLSCWLLRTWPQPSAPTTVTSQV